MARVIAITNQKGGVGKTTTSINLAACLVEAGQRVLLVDMDSQANSTSGLGIDKNAVETSIYHVLIGEANLQEIIRPIAVDFDLAPSNPHLIGAEVELIQTLAREQRLKNALQPLREAYDFIIIDCPPSLGLLTINSLTASDKVLIPIQSEYYALEGLQQLLNTIELLKRSGLNSTLDIEGVLITMYDQRLNLSKQVMEEVESFFKDKIYKTVIPRNVRLSESPSFGQTIIEYAPDSSGAQSYQQLAKEVLSREG
ncbi:MAG: ParA family protein [Gemmatimonadetes bacterium]|nr:MAG: ParA family protein [Gemmatimonadota bacterium]